VWPFNNYGNLVIISRDVLNKTHSSPLYTNCVLQIGYKLTFYRKETWWFHPSIIIVPLFIMNHWPKLNYSIHPYQPELALWQTNLSCEYPHWFSLFSQHLVHSCVWFQTKRTLKFFSKTKQNVRGLQSGLIWRVFEQTLNSGQWVEFFPLITSLVSRGTITTSATWTFSRETICLLETMNRNILYENHWFARFVFEKLENYKFHLKFLSVSSNSP